MRWRRAIWHPAHLGWPTGPAPLVASGVRGLWSLARVSAVTARPRHWAMGWLLAPMWLLLGMMWWGIRYLERKRRQRGE